MNEASETVCECPSQQFEQRNKAIVVTFLSAPFRFIYPNGHIFPHKKSTFMVKRQVNHLASNVFTVFLFFFRGFISSILPNLGNYKIPRKFSNRVVYEWNKLSNEIISVESIMIF